MTRREELTEAAADYLLDHGLIGLSLRPLAAALGHERPDAALPLRRQGRPGGDRDPERASTGASPSCARLPAARGRAPLRAPLCGGVPAGRGLGSASGSTSRPRRSGCSASSRTSRGARDQRAVGGGGRATLLAAGVPGRPARRVTYLLDAAFLGFQLDLPLDRGSRRPEALVSRTSPTPCSHRGPPRTSCPAVARGRSYDVPGQSGRR